MKLMVANIKLLLICFFAFSSCNTTDNEINPSKTIKFILPNKPSEILHRATQVFSERVNDRSEVKIVSAGNADLEIELIIDSAIGNEGFRVEDAGRKRIMIAGASDRGIIYGIGKFLRTSRFEPGGFLAGGWRGVEVPEQPVRGMYFATHFYNYYQTAPVEELQRYVEDLALWGVNHLMVWYDMHHFNGPDDSDAIALHTRLNAIMTAGRQIGMSVGLMLIGNEGYTNSPINLRAAGGGRGAYYPEGICPNKKGGMDYILKIIGEHLDRSASLRPEYICIWPYDPGGCGSADCQPWGSNGFVKCVRSISKMAKAKIPGIKTVISTWYYDSTEWKGLSDTLAADPALADYVMVEDVPGFVSSSFSDLSSGHRMLGFPEISMYNTFPWGGFGATPLPEHLLQQWKVQKGRLSGGFPYSEGIFEDISKVVYAQLYWNSSRSTDEIIKEYIGYEYAPTVKDDVLKVIRTLEQNHHMRWWPGKLEGVKLTMDWFPSKGEKPQADPGAEEAYALIKIADSLLPEWSRRSWRWRILYIRTMLDAELKLNNGVPNNNCIQGFYELMKIYHTNEKSDPVVRPPVPLPQIQN